MVYGCSSDEENAGNRSAAGGGSAYGGASGDASAGSGGAGAVDGSTPSRGTGGSGIGDAQGGETTGGSSGAGGTTVGGGGSGGTGSGVISSDGGACVLIDGTGCIGVSSPARLISLDVYIMFDQTGSTCVCIDPPDASPGTCPPTDCNATRLDAIREAATAFIRDPGSTGIGVGIGYFGQFPIGQASCNPADYDDPAVPIAELPGNADAIIQSMNSVVPTGETPSGAAIRGACTYASQWKASHPGHETVILLVTDGNPEAEVTCAGGTGPCCPSLQDTVAAALACANGTPSVKTYVLGVGPFLANLQQIAVAGGTAQAYLVESGNVVQNVLNALGTIRTAAMPCDLRLPPPPTGTALNPNQVNIAYANAVCEGRAIRRVDSVASCDNTGGWYYDDPSSPQRIHLCSATCDLMTDPNLHLLFSVGCSTVIDPP